MGINFVLTAKSSTTVRKEFRSRWNFSKTMLETGQKPSNSMSACSASQCVWRASSSQSQANSWTNYKEKKQTKLYLIQIDYFCCENNYANKNLNIKHIWKIWCVSIIIGLALWKYRKRCENKKCNATTMQPHDEQIKEKKSWKIIFKKHMYQIKI